MKIHIVQKGDTLWEISKKYGVNFEELKAMNTQLSSPDMIMPGMKIKVPGSSKAVKKETIAKKETKKEAIKPYKDTSPKPIAAITEDDHKIQKPITPEMPIPAMPQMPILDQDIKQYTTINFPQMPQMKPQPIKEKKKEVKKEVKKEEYKPQPIKQKPIHHPIQPIQPIQPLQPIQPAPVHQPPIQPVHHQQPMMQPCAPMVPICCCHFQPPCCQPMPMPCHHPSDHLGGQMAPVFEPPVQKSQSDCGCQGGQMVPYPDQQMLPYPNQQMESHTHMMPDAYPMPGPAGGMYPPQFRNMQEEGDFYPKPPSFPNFTELQTDNNDDKQDK